MPGQELRLLALDGGGVRGLSSLIILEQLMETINRDSPPKPCEYFDMIGGTSTGGLIAIMLGRLKMSISDCIDAYLSLSDRIFQKKRHWLTIKGNIQGRFDSEELARAVKDVVAKQGELKEDALLKDTSDDACKVFVCATSKQTSETVCLTSYKSPRGGNDLLNSVKIWEACCATSAASSFFDPIAIGRYGEEFVDGATGANNPVWEVWNQAQLIWGPQPLEGRIKCLVSIGTGVPLLKPFEDNILHINKTLIAIAIETEQTANKFRQDKTHLDDTGRYYRFNVTRGLEKIGLEESKKRKEIAAATRRYVGLQDVLKQMQACADNMAGREYFGKFRINFSLEGIPRVNKFVDRPTDMAKLERALLPGRGNCRQKIYILHGLGGIGKTQLAVEFARRNHRKYSSVFWLDGRSEDSFKRSAASCGGRIPEGQISEISRTYSAGGSGNLDVVVKEVMGWLTKPDNTEWLLIYDNVDREYNPRDPDPEAYDVKRYLPSADHGTVLVTTRLAKLEQLGDSQKLGKVDMNQSETIFQSRYNREYDPVESERLFGLLDGLPLAIAQAAAFLRESGVGLGKYLQFYEQQWKELMELRDPADAQLQDYPYYNVSTTWTISYNAIRKKDKGAANLLLLWAHLDNKDLWHGLFAAACQESSSAIMRLTECIGKIASNELEFTKAIQLLRNYSLIEDVENPASDATHPVVHRWAYHFQDEDFRVELAQLAVVVVGSAVPYKSTRDYPTKQRRLLPHAQACSRWAVADDVDFSKIKDKEATLAAIHKLGYLYADQGKMAEAEKMFERALQGNEKLLGPIHPSTLDMVHDLGIFYKNLGKPTEAENMYKRALRGYSKMLDPTHTHTRILETFNNLGDLYTHQGKLAEAEEMLEQAFRGNETIRGPMHPLTLNTVNNLGALYIEQGKLAEAEKMYQRALRGFDGELGPMHTSTLGMINNLGILYEGQGKLAEAEEMYERALRGFEKTLGPSHMSVLDIIRHLGDFYANQGKLTEAEKMYERALRGYEKILNSRHILTLNSVSNLGVFYLRQGKLAEAEKMYERAIRGYGDAIGLENVERCQPALFTMVNKGILYVKQGELTKAREMYSRVLSGFYTILGPSSEEYQDLKARIESLNQSLDKAQSIANPLSQKLINHIENSVCANQQQGGNITGIWFKSQ